MNKNKDIGFKVPEGYFDDFNRRIQEKIDSGNNNKPVKQKSLIARYPYAAAAVIVLLIASSYLLIPFQKEANSTQIPNTSLSEISDAEYFGINMNDLYYAYNDEIEGISLAEINEEELIDYLAEESDYNELILLTE